MSGYQTGGSFTWKSSATPDPGIRSVTVVAQDCSMIFARIVGVLTLNDFDILDARSYRQENNTLAILKVRAIGERRSEAARLKQAEKDLRAVRAGSVNLGRVFREKQRSFRRTHFQAPSHMPIGISVSNSSSFLFTTIEISANDFPGILFTISDTILRCGLEIWNTKIATQKDRISDTFYVKKTDGRKISSPERIITVKTKLRTALVGLGAVGGASALRPLSGFRRRTP
ncbi:[protein-PII] uridylyltransferase [Desulfonema ishimotonii]|uniref:[protein-PII] uridylyltransferase n=2 Tax=Desulfonema ishimotonii TaxID=45657 RepID=A0A401G2Q8_9BACT|nr:[protein-PII] uridylyltransferase [Desulfonema ishimotonii]